MHVESEITRKKSTTPKRYLDGREDARFNFFKTVKLKTFIVEHTLSTIKISVEGNEFFLESQIYYHTNRMRMKCLVQGG